MRHAFVKLPEILKAPEKGRDFLMFFDYDGTLTPIVKKPEYAKLSGSNRKVLLGLKALKNLKVALISGRSLKDLVKRVGIKGLIYAGNHGLELIGPNLNFKHKKAFAFRKLIGPLKKRLEEISRDFEGVFIEDKGLSLSVHFRELKDSSLALVLLTKIKEQLKALRLSGFFTIRPGKKVFEIRPKVSWDKGKIVRFILKTGQLKRPLACYIGDDVTDEDAFKSLRGEHISIVVGKKKSNARFYLKDVPQVYEFLERIIKAQPVKR